MEEPMDDLFLPPELGRVINVRDRAMLARAEASGRFTYVGGYVPARRPGARVWKASVWENRFRRLDLPTEEVLALYRQHVLDNLAHRLPELENRILGCWCWPSPCHASTLVELVDELAGR
jgi:hypothetical protein